MTSRTLTNADAAHEPANEVKAVSGHAVNRVQTANNPRPDAGGGEIPNGDFGSGAMGGIARDARSFARKGGTV